MSKEAKEKEVIKKIKEILKRQGVEFEAVEVELKRKMHARLHGDRT